MTLEEARLFKKTPSSTDKKSKNKLGYLMPRSFCTAKKMFYKMSMNPTAWEKNLHSTHDIGLISRVYKELKKLNNNKTDNPVKK